jgi:hypothetical protein
MLIWRESGVDKGLLRAVSQCARADHRPGVGRLRTDEDSHQGALAGPVLPDQTHHLTGKQAETGPAQHLLTVPQRPQAASVRLVNPGGDQQFRR